MFNTLGIISQSVWSFLKTYYHVYLLATAPVEYNNTTLVFDESVDRQANRATLYKRCLYLNGSTDYVNVNYVMNTAFTVTMWFKITALPVSGAYTLWQDTNQYYRGQIHSDGHIYIDCGSNIIWNRFSSSDIRLGEWNVITFRYDSTETDFVDKARFWLNKKELVSTGTQGTPSTSATTAIEIGRRVDNANYFNGHIKQVIFSDTAQSEALCSAHLTTGTQYLFEEDEAGGSVTTVYSNSGEEGTITATDITTVRAEQEDAPLLPESGDYVGFSKLRLFSTDIENATINNDNFSSVRYYNDNTGGTFAIPKQSGYYSPNGELSSSIATDGSGNKYFVISYNTGTGANFNKEQITGYNAVKIHFDIVQGKDCRMTFRDFSRWESFSAWLLADYSVSNINTVADTPEKVYLMMSGTDATYGDTYPDDVLGITGLTFSEVRTKLTEQGTVNVTAFVNAVNTAIYTNGKSPTWESLLKLQRDETLTNTPGVYNQTRDLTEITASYDYNNHIGGLYYQVYPTQMVKANSIILSFRSNTSGDVHYTKLYEVSFINENATVPANINNPALDAVYNAPLEFTGRKDQPQKIGGAAILLDTTRNKEIQCSQSLTGVTVTAVYGQNANTGEQLTTADIGVDTANDKLYNDNAAGDNIAVARIDLSDGTQLVYLGGLDNDGIEVSSIQMRDASQVDGNDATILFDTDNYNTSQNFYNHWAVYGASSGKSFNINVANDTQTSYTENASKKTAEIKWDDTSGIEYRIYNFGTDGLGNLINDPNGNPQGQTVINAKACINQYADLADPSVTYYNGSIWVTLTGSYTAGTIKVNLETTGALNYIDCRDVSLTNRFKALVHDYYGVSDIYAVSGARISTPQDLFNALNGGINQGGACPNGLDDDYPNTTLGINTANGYSYNATSTKLRELLEEAFTQGATASNFLDSLVTDGDNTNTALSGSALSYILTRVFQIYFTSNTGVINEVISVNDIIATGSLTNNVGNTFFQNYERTGENYSSVVFRGNVSIETHTQWYNISIAENEILPCLTDGSNTDVRFGETAEYPSGVCLANNQKQYANLPNYKTLQNSFESNEELGKATTDANGNAVVKKHLAPISLGHRDKGFPCWRNGGSDYFTLTTPLNVLNNTNDTFRITALITSYANSSYGTLIGKSNSDNYIIGLNGDNYGFRFGIDVINQSTGLDVSEIGAFIYDAYLTRTGANEISVTFTITDLLGNVLSTYSQSGVGTSGNDLDILFASIQASAVRNLLADVAWVKVELNDTLTHWWQYTGDYLLEDVLNAPNGNHGTLTTADVTANQGEQNVFNPFVDGYSIDSVVINATNWSAGNIIGSSREHFINGELWYFDSNHSGGGFANWSATYENNYLNLKPDHVLTSNETFYLFRNNVSSSYLRAGLRYRVTVTFFMPTSSNWNRIYFSGDSDWLDSSGQNTLFFPNASEQTMILEFVPSANLAQNDIQIRVLALNGYDPATDSACEIRNFKIEIIEKGLSKYPYNGLDTFDNALSTPRSTERTKALNTTGNA